MWSNGICAWRGRYRPDLEKPYVTDSLRSLCFILMKMGRLLNIEVTRLDIHFIKIFPELVQKIRSGNKKERFAILQEVG